MQAQRFVELGEFGRRDVADAPPQAFRGDRADLLCLCFGVGRKTGDDATTKTGRGRVGPVIADDDGRAVLGGLVCPHRIEVDRVSGNAALAT